MRRLRILIAVAVGLALFSVASSATPSGTVTSARVEAPRGAVEIEDPQVNEIRRFMQERGTSVTAAAEVLQSSLELPIVSRSQDSGGCHGPTWTAEHEADDGPEPNIATQAMVDSIVGDLIDNGPVDLASALVALDAAGGGLRLDTEGRLDDANIAIAVGDDLFVSADWIHAAIQDPASVHANLAHEISGHMEYDTPLSCVILETALADSDAIADFDQYRTAYLTYVYPETEIYAELHELAFHSDSAIGDDPYVDIIVQVRKLEAAFPPELAALILDWIRLRCATDPTISIEARFYCQAAVQPNSTSATSDSEQGPG